MSSSTATRNGISLPALIALVGCDGAGKTTMATDLVAALARQHPATFVYLGQSSGNIARAIERLPLLGAPITRWLRHRSERAHAQARSAGPKRPDTAAAIVMFILSHWRAYKFRQALKLQKRGIIVVTDRYPQAEVPGFWFDGPGITPDPSAPALIRWLCRREWQLYRKMAAYVPTLVIRIDIDAMTAHARKPDHDPAMLEAKIDTIPKLKFHAAPILVLSGTADYQHELQRAVEAARKALGLA